MFAKQISRIVIVIVAAAIVLSIVGFAAAPVFAQRHVEAAVVSAGRHTLTSCTMRPLDTTDYFFRHRELSATRSADLTDYYFRHPTC